MVAEDKRVAQRRGRELPAGFTIVKAPAGLAPVLAPVMHLVDALVRMRLLADDTAMSVPFETRAGKMSLLKGDAALAARRQVASHITERTITALRRPLNSEDPDLELMQQLYDAGIRKCPCSGMPIFNPSACSLELRAAIWRSYVGVATTVNTSALGTTADALDELKAQLQEHAREQ